MGGIPARDEPRRPTADERRAGRCRAQLRLPDVEAHQASGNVVFNDDRPAGELTTTMSDDLAEALGYPVPVFLHAQPSAQVLDDVVTLVPTGGVLVPAGRELHWLPATGVGDSTLDFRRLDQLIGGEIIRIFFASTIVGILRRIAPQRILKGWAGGMAAGRQARGA